MCFSTSEAWSHGFDVFIGCWDDLETGSVSRNQAVTAGARDLMTPFWALILTPRLHPVQADVVTPEEGGVGGSAQAGADIRGLRLWQGEVLDFWQGGLW